jgi:hypothetical protein
VKTVPGDAAVRTEYAESGIRIIAGAIFGSRF